MSIYEVPGWKKGTFSGVVYNYLAIKPTSPDKPTFLCLHGFPTGMVLYTTVLFSLDLDFVDSHRRFELWQGRSSAHLTRIWRDPSRDARIRRYG